MSDMTDSEQLAGLTATVIALRDEVHGMRSDLKDQRDSFVPSREFIAWKTGLDREIADTKATLRNEILERKSSRAPWWSVGSLVVAASALALTIVLALQR